MIKLLDKVYNFFLSIRYNLLKKYITPVSFGNPSYTADFNKPDYEVTDGYWYGSKKNMVTTKEDVEVKDNELILCSTPYNKEHTNWDGETKVMDWGIGWVEFRNHMKQYGTWEAEMSVSNNKLGPAFWLLSERHREESTTSYYTVYKVKESTLYTIKPITNIKKNWYVYYNNECVGRVIDYTSNTITLDSLTGISVTDIIGLSPDHILPEVDVMELFYNKISHTVHYGYSTTEYATKSFWANPCIHIPNRYYKYAVTISPKGYKFYIDGILTGVIRDPEAIAHSKLWVILNNGAGDMDSNTEGQEIVKVKSLKYYESKS